MRDYNSEAKSLPDKKYDYNFDFIVREYMMRSFKPFFKKGAALELGCHEGDSTRLFSGYFDDMTVIEASSDSIAIAQNQVPESVTFIHSTFENVVLDRKYDSIFLINTLEHIDDSIDTLKRIKSWLSPTGQFFVMVPNADAPSRQIAVHMGLLPTNNSVSPREWEHGHRRTYSFDTLESDLRTAGLKATHRGGLMFKALANFQLDKALEAGIIDENYIEGIYNLGMVYPNLCSSIYMICEHGN